MLLSPSLIIYVAGWLGGVASFCLHLVGFVTYTRAQYTEDQRQLVFLSVHEGLEVEAQSS